MKCWICHEKVSKIKGIVRYDKEGPAHSTCFFARSKLDITAKNIEHFNSASGIRRIMGTKEINDIIKRNEIGEVED